MTDLSGRFLPESPSLVFLTHVGAARTRPKYKSTAYAVCMSTRRISVSEDAYRVLSASKGRDESFSDAVLRLARRRSLTDLAGVVDRRAGEAIAAAIRATRSRRFARRTASDFP